MDTSATVTVRIVEPHRAYARYTVDSEVLRLSAIDYPREEGPADLAVIPGTAPSAGDELEALILGEVAHPPGCLVEAAPVGMLTCERNGAPTPYILTVAAGDARFTSAVAREALPDGWRARLERAFGADSVRWGSCADAWALIRELRQAARLARSGGPRRLAGPAWLPDRADLPAAHHGPRPRPRATAGRSTASTPCRCVFRNTSPIISRPPSACASLSRAPRWPALYSAGGCVAPGSPRAS